MALYLIGDIQGCHSELDALLTKVSFNPKYDQLWAAGDLVARGENSLATIELLQSLGNSFNTVLGNHDLHLMSIYYGIKKAKKSDKLDNLIQDARFGDMVDWLAQFPLLLALPDGKSYLSHAGLSPQWSIEEAIENARFAEKRIRSIDRKKWLLKMYGSEPNQWRDVKSKTDRFRYTVNAFTRMRFCYQDGGLEFDCKSTLDQAPKELAPWFDLTQKSIRKQHTWYFGHWAALMGKTNQSHAIALDTGCVWGHHMTMLNFDSKKRIIEDAHQGV